MKSIHELLQRVRLNKRTNEDDLAYMSRVEAALRRTGRIGPMVLSVGACVLAVLLLIWANFAELDEVTRGQGQVVGAQRTQIIQNLEGGILREVLVRDGDEVKKGQILARLDNADAESRYRDAVNKAAEHRVALVRLEAEKNEQPPDFSPDLRAKYPQIIRDQEEVYATRSDKFASERHMLESQYRQRQRDVEEQRGRKEQAERNLVLAKERMEIARPLMERKVYARVDFLDLEQRVVTLQGDIAALTASLSKAEEASDEAHRKLKLRSDEFEAQISEEINKRRSELTSFEELISTGSDRVTRTEVRSPVRGVVKQIIINTLGGVVRPGDPIMEVVPLDDTLLIEARIRPADIAFVHPRQRAVVKVSAYDFSIYGGLEARVEQISADTMEDKRGEFYYLVKLRTAKNSIAYRSEQLPIIPGMVATVDIISGKKSILDYLLKPILKARQNALRER